MKRHAVRNLLILQIVVVVIAAAVLFFVRANASYPGLAALYGGAMALANTLLLAFRTRRASVEKSSPRGQAAGLMVGMIERLVVTLVGFALGMGWLGLDPISLLIGFAVAQLAYTAGGRSLREAAIAGMTQQQRQR